MRTRKLQSLLLPHSCKSSQSRRNQKTLRLSQSLRWNQNPRHSLSQRLSPNRNLCHKHSLSLHQNRSLSLCHQHSHSRRQHLSLNPSARLLLKSRLLGNSRSPNLRRSQRL